MSIKHLLINCATGVHTVEDTPQSWIDAMEARQSAKITAFKASEAQKATDKASGNQKLLDLGLSQAEVDALTK